MSFTVISNPTLIGVEHQVVDLTNPTPVVLGRFADIGVAEWFAAQCSDADDLPAAFGYPSIAEDREPFG